MRMRKRHRPTTASQAPLTTIRACSQPPHRPTPKSRRIRGLRWPLGSQVTGGTLAHGAVAFHGGARKQRAWRRRPARRQARGLQVRVQQLHAAGRVVLQRNQLLHGELLQPLLHVAGQRAAVVEGQQRLLQALNQPTPRVDRAPVQYLLREEGMVLHARNSAALLRQLVSKQAHEVQRPLPLSPLRLAALQRGVWEASGRSARGHGGVGAAAPHPRGVWWPLRPRLPAHAARGPREQDRVAVQVDLEPVRRTRGLEEAVGGPVEVESQARDHCAKVAGRLWGQPSLVGRLPAVVVYLAAHQQHQQQYAEGIHVRREPVHLPPRVHLGGCVAEGAAERLGERGVDPASPLRLRDRVPAAHVLLGQPKIGQLRMAVHAQDDVLQLQVPEDDASCVEVLESQGYLRRDLQGPAQRKSRGPLVDEQLLKVSVRTVLHDHDPIPYILEGVDQLHHKRVVPGKM
mmetsp:Transcript_40024/g.104313  ORF Transcript_40024/g.104313 Transcript_40024/m.104313 type:complete len:458 (-) Transcript_40024:786-2159(-)